MASIFTSWKFYVIILIIIALIIASIFAFFYVRANQSNQIYPIEDTKANCNEDFYNCDDFTSFEKAKDVFEVCNSLGYGDIHQLDSNGDGIPCESLK